MAKTQIQKVKFKLPSRYVKTMKKNRQAMNETMGSTLLVCERLFHGCFHALHRFEGFQMQQEEGDTRTLTV